MTDCLLSFEVFKLPFADESSEDYAEEDAETSEDGYFDIDQQKILMEKLIPSECDFLGSINTNIFIWTVKEDYYLMPLNDGDFDWAIFRINWDDNWCRWTWAFDARLKGLKNQPLAAARLMLNELWQYWDIEVSSPEGRPYVEFLEKLNQGIDEDE